MHTSVAAAVLSAACLLSACGFVPPAPPMPDDAPRVAINHGDPRQLRNVQPSDAVAAPEPMKVALTPTPTTEQPTVETSVTAGSGPSPTNTATAIPAAASIPVPEAPPKTNAAAMIAPSDVPAATSSKPAQPPTAPLTAEQRTEPIVATASLVPTEDAKPALPIDATPVHPVIAAEPDLKPTPVVVKEIWHIGPEDATVRQALARWANKAGWTFGPDQWELNFDLPIQAPAQFEAESFQEATQALSQAIAMTESPVRPCFYANRVLRVIPFTRSCNRAPTATPSS